RRMRRWIWTLLWGRPAAAGGATLPAPRRPGAGRWVHRAPRLSRWLPRGRARRFAPERRSRATARNALVSCLRRPPEPRVPRILRVPAVLAARFPHGWRAFPTPPRREPFGRGPTGAVQRSTADKIHWSPSRWWSGGREMAEHRIEKDSMG